MKRILTLIVCAVALHVSYKSQTLEIALFQETGFEEATRASLLNYSSEHGPNFTFSERVLAQGCDSILTFLEEMDVAIFLGGSKPTHCNWIDLVPQLHSFVNEGGTLIFQGPVDPLSFGSSTFLFDEGQWNLYFDEAPWFGILEDHQFWCCGLAVQNANCEGSGTLFGTAHADHPILDDVYDYSADSAQCHMMINEPSWFSLTEPDLSDPRFFSIYEYGTAINSGEPTLTALQDVGSSTQMIFGKSIGLGEVLFFGENNPLPNPHQGSQNLLGNLITHFGVTPGCMNQAACNYDASANVDDGSCTELDACGDCGGEGISGCTTTEACNYNPAASCDDGSCIYAPVIDLGDDIATCEDSVMLDAGPGFGSYLWSTGDTTQTIEVSESGQYDLTVAASSAEDAYSLSILPTEGDNQLVVSGTASSALDVSSTNRLTYSAWLKPLSLDNHSFVLHHAGEIPGQGQYSLQVMDGKAYFTSAGGANWPGSFESNGFIVSNSDLIIGEWNHVTLHYDGQAMRIFLNGALDFEVYVEDEFPVTYIVPNQFAGLSVTGEFFLGSNNAGGQRFNGDLDDISVWNRALTDAEIQALYFCKENLPVDGLVGHWSFDEGSGNVIDDESGNGSDLTIHEATRNLESLLSDCTGQCSSSATIAVNILGQGCTAPEACNYNPAASCDDGSCIYAPVIDLGDDIETCEDSVLLDAGPGFDSYLWSTGDTTQTLSVLESGEISVQGTQDIQFSLDFTGEEQNIIISEIPEYEAESHTVSVWCKPAGFSNYDLVSKDDEANNRQWLLQITNQGRFQGHVWTGDDDLTEIQSPTVMEIGQWYYLTQTWDGELFKTYINGNLEGVKVTQGPLQTGDHPITIGGDDLAPNFWTNGLLDDVQIWDIALNEEAIQSFMMCGPEGDEDGLVGLWRFNEGEGSSVYDMSIHGNHGDVNGIQWSNDIPETICSGQCSSSATIAVDILGQGCTAPQACNYNPTASCDDGSCIYAPVIDLGDDIETCEDSVVLDAGPGFDSYLWSTGETTQQINAVDDGEYSVSASINPAINEFALDFDGSTGSAQPEGPISFGMESFTVSIDCKLRAFEGNDSTNDSYIIGHPLTGGTNDHGFKIQTISESINNGGFTAHINDEGTTHYHVISFSNELDANVVTDRWYDLTIVVDRDNALFSFYVDGQLVGNEIIHDDFGDLDHPDGISLGIQSIHGSHLLNGFLDNLHIWDIPLSAERVAALQFAPPSVGETGLLGYWDFDEGQGSVANDLTGQSPSVILHDVLWTGDAPNVFSGPGCQSEDSCLVSFLLQGCTDPDACNFDLEAICDDGNCATCEALQGACGPGTIWDSETSQCVIEESCGWNPDSDADSLVGVSDLLMFLSVFGSEWPVFNCGDPVLYQGYEYETVQIGEQCWFAENLNSSSAGGGDIIEIQSHDDWLSNYELGIPGFCYPDFSEEHAQQYGKLYNIHAILSSDLCPNNWHVSTDEDWFVLEMFLGLPLEALTSEARLAYDIGYDLKDDAVWNGNNSSGFGAVPAGEKSGHDFPFSVGHKASFLTTTQPQGFSSYVGRVLFDEGFVTRDYLFERGGYSIRCIKDTE